MTQLSIPEEIARRAQSFTGRLWVVDEVIDWLDRRSERFLLITGEPGSGKTALAAWLAGAGPRPEEATARQKLERVDKAWTAAHFCVAEDQRGTLHPGRFAQSLASQLSGRFDHYGVAVIQRVAPSIDIHQEVRENWGNVIGAQIGTLIINNDNVDDIYNAAVREPLEELLKLQPGLDVLILVDALDEAQTFYQPNQPNIVTLLAGSGDLPEGVRFVLTGRNEPKVTERFRQARRLDLSSQDEARSRAYDQDIRNYVEQRLAHDAMKSHLAAIQSTEAIKDSLVQQAAGNFLYVKFLLDGVANDHHSLTDVVGLPHGLYGVYRTYMNRLVPEMVQNNRSELWEKELQPLLGSLSVATPAAPREALPEWLGQSESLVKSRLNEIRQITEDVSAVELDERLHHRLYHRSMAEFLAADRYQENGEKNVFNRYYIAPREQHERIVLYYLDNFQGQWQECDIYGLRQLVTHMRAWLPLEQKPKARQEIAKKLYAVVLDEEFRAAQRQKLGNTNATLTDLQTVLDIALARDDIAKGLGCVGAYRDTIRSASIAQPIFEAVNRRDFNRALQAAEQYAATSDWGQVLCLYVAWEAAEAARKTAETSNDIAPDSDIEAAEEALVASQRYTLTGAGNLGDALLVRTARTCARAAGDAGDPRAWLVQLGQMHDADWLLEQYHLAQPLEPIMRAPLLNRAKEAVEQLMREDSEMRGQGVSMLEFVSGQLQGNLVQIAAEPEGQESIDKALRRVVTNPYPQYRNVGLAALGVATLAVPEAWWASRRLQLILRTKLDSEGATFTFDLPAILLAEAERRQLQAPELAAYLEKALTIEDRWGTAVRAHSARAAALYWQGEKARALDLLKQAGRLPSGYAGYTAVNLLSLANRCCEFGQPDFAESPVWGSNGDTSLLDGAAQAADYVVDPDFRNRRVQLVDDYRTWYEQPTPNPSALKTALTAISDHDTRQAYIEYLSARLAGQNDMSQQNIKTLLPYTLFAGTTLDTVLGRLVGPRVRQLSDDDLGEAFRVCTRYLMTGRPWELRQWR
jgi:energy-coupling factor transporter ATP-binding protein EcfA2